MKVIAKPFSYDKDLGQARKFLLEVYRLTGALHYLIPTKIENQKYGPCGPEYTPEDDKALKIWQKPSNEDSDIIAISHRGSAGNYHIEVHPGHKHVESAIFKEIEMQERGSLDKQSGRIYMYTVSSDSSRPSVLRGMGYEDYGLHEYNYKFPGGTHIPDNQAPEGFKVRGLKGEQDYTRFVEVIGSVYEHCREHMTLEKMKFMTQAEFYHQDLHLVATDNTGKFVAFCMCRLDPLTGIAEMEAVDVLPEYSGVGLETALLSEGLRRVMKYQPNLVCAVEVDVSEPLNQMLEDAGFVRTVTMNMWGKIIESEKVEPA